MSDLTIENMSKSFDYLQLNISEKTLYTERLKYYILF